MSRDWPAGWEDPEDAELDAAEFDGEDDVRLSEVAAFLATVPAPVVPGGIESRIVAAIAAESASRAADSPVRAPEPDAPRILRPRPPTRARVRRRDRNRARPAIFDRIRPAMVAGPLVAILLFSGLGYVISLAGGQSSSSSGPMAASEPSPASSAAAGTVPGPQYNGTSGRGTEGSVANAKGFALTRSGTDYRQATLALQVRTVIAAAKRAPAPAVPSASASSSSPASASSQAASSAAAAASSPASAFSSQLASLANLPPNLHSCVVHFTGGAAPTLIDQANYQGTPAYVIVSASHVWVVGLGCTAAHPDLIASAPLG